MNIRIGKLSQFLFPEYGYCGKCQTTWNLVTAHTTPYGEVEVHYTEPEIPFFYTIGHGCFPLCEKCWSELDIESRIPYYVRLARRWNNKEKESQIIDAVRKGL